jgi:hypothetical protein
LGEEEKKRLNKPMQGACDFDATNKDVVLTRACSVQRNEDEK